MAIITLGDLRDLWKTVADWVSGTSGVKPAVRSEELENRLGSLTDVEATDAGSINAILKRIRTLLGNLDGKDFATQTTLSSLDSHLAALETALGAITDAEAETGDGSIVAIIKRLRTLLGNLDGKDFATQTTLATLATETTLQACQTLLNNLDGKDYATQTTLSSADGHLANLDSDVGAPTDVEATGDGSVIAILKRLRTLLGNLDGKNFATETTLALVATEATLQAVQNVLTAIKDTDGIKKITDALPAGTNKIGSVDVDIADGADVAQGATTDAIIAAGADGSVIANLKRLTTDLNAVKTDVASLEALLTAVKDTDGIKKITDSLPAGSNVIGQVAIDQTTPGTTNGVQVNAALPAGDNNIGNVDVFVADGDDATQGATTDAAQTDPGQSATVIALLKGLLSQLQGSGNGAAPAVTAGQTTTKQATITSGTSLSGEVDLEGYRYVAIKMPAAWDAASLTFQASDASGGTFYDLYSGGTEVQVTVDAQQVVALDSQVMAPLRYIKIRSGTSATPVNQSADRTLTVILKA